jgi:thiol-disulfide isomerase/thioredoxin
MTVIATLLLIAPAAINAQVLKKAPPLTLQDIHGRTVRLIDYKGKILLINFWATWCPPCRTEVPDLIKIQRKYRGRGLRIIGVTYPPEKLARVNRFAHRAGMNYRVVLGDKATKLLFTDSETLPMTVIVDREGSVREIVEGILLPEEFKEMVEPLLSATPGTQVKRRTTNLERKSSIQTATIIVTADGYRPASIKLLSNVPARLTFIRRTMESCGTEIVIPEYGINRPLGLKIPVVVEFTPHKSGTFKFTCGMDMFRGSLVVR